MFPRAPLLVLSLLSVLARAHTDALFTSSISYCAPPTAVLVQQSRLGEISRDELAEVITEAWAAKAPRKLVREFFGE